MDLYVNCEGEDGYLRDSCVWDNKIDTYDTMTVEVKYNTGVLLSYSLNAFLPYEGQKIAFNGQKGRLDARIFQRQPWEPEHVSNFRLTHSFKETKTWGVDPSEGEHGGAVQIYWANKYIIASMYGEFVPGAEALDKVMARFNLPRFDPQTGERDGTEQPLS